jgi:hypothetical protein
MIYEALQINTAAPIHQMHRKYASPNWSQIIFTNTVGNSLKSPVLGEEDWRKKRQTPRQLGHWAPGLRTGLPGCLPGHGPRLLHERRPLSPVARRGCGPQGTSFGCAAHRVSMDTWGLSAGPWGGPPPPALAHCDVVLVCTLWNCDVRFFFNRA